MASTTPREWAIAVGGGLLLAAGLVWALRGDEPEMPDRVTVAAPAMVPPPVAQAPVAMLPAGGPSATPPGGTTDIKLRGIIQRPGTAAAIVELPDGRQRLVREGGEALPGVQVESVGPDAVMIRRGGMLERLGFSDSPAQPVAPGATAGSGSTSGSASLAALAARPLDYRLGMKPRKVGSETKGYAIADIAGLPLFRRAGLREGDVVISVNGNALVSSEKILDLPGEVAGAYDVKIVFERGGVQETATIAIER